MTVIVTIDALEQQLLAPYLEEQAEHPNIVGGSSDRADNALSVTSQRAVHGNVYYACWTVTEQTKETDRLGPKNRVGQSINFLRRVRPRRQLEPSMNYLPREQM